jgi:hypothetical protein
LLPAVQAHRARAVEVGDEIAGIAQGAQFAAAGQRNRIVEGTVPGFVTHRAAGSVPDLTFGADIKLNERYSLRRHASRIRLPSILVKASQRQLGRSVFLTAPRDLASEQASIRS